MCVNGFALRLILEEASERYGFEYPYKNIKNLKEVKSDVMPFTMDEVWKILQNVREDCQPSLPMNDPAGIEISPDEIQAVRRRLDLDDLTVLAYRFEGDRFCRAQRFETYIEALGDRFIARVLPDSAAKVHV